MVSREEGSTACVQRWPPRVRQGYISAYTRVHSRARQPPRNGRFCRQNVPARARAYPSFPSSDFPRNEGVHGSSSTQFDSHPSPDRLMSVQPTVRWGQHRAGRPWKPMARRGSEHQGFGDVPAIRELPGRSGQDRDAPYAASCSRRRSRVSESRRSRSSENPCISARSVVSVGGYPRISGGKRAAIQAVTELGKSCESRYFHWAVPRGERQACIAPEVMTSHASPVWRASRRADRRDRRAGSLLLHG